MKVVFRLAVMVLPLITLMSSLARAAAPVAGDLTVSTVVNVAIDITLPATDDDGDLLAYFVLSTKGGDSTSVNGNVITFTPAADFGGTTSFTYVAFDGTTLSNVATITVLVEAPPLVSDQLVRTGIDTAVEFMLSASDPNGDALTYLITGGPSAGTLSGSPPLLTYTPGGAFRGNDSFTYTASDGTFTSVPATVTLDVRTGVIIDDVVAVEGHAGSTAFNFTVTFFGNITGGFTLPWSTADGTAAAPIDYASATGTLGFGGFDGEQQSITIFVAGDAEVEGDETFEVILGSPSSPLAEVLDGSGTGTILEDEGPRISDYQSQVRNPAGDFLGLNVPVTDAAAGGTLAVLVTFDRATDFGGCGVETITVNDGCRPFPITFATAGEDASGTLVFRLGRWLSRNNVYLEYDIVDINQQIADVDVHFTGGVGRKEEASLTSADQVLADVLQIDMRNPSLGAVLSSRALVGEGDVGSAAFWLTVTFDEAMDTSIDPVISFPSQDPSATLTAVGGSWIDAMSYEAVFDVADGDQDLPGVDVGVTGAVDRAGNLQVPGVAPAVFAIDSSAPADERFAIVNVSVPGNRQRYGFYSASELRVDESPETLPFPTGGLCITNGEYGAGANVGFLATTGSSRFARGSALPPDASDRWDEPVTIIRQQFASDGATETIASAVPLVGSGVCRQDAGIVCGEDADCGRDNQCIHQLRLDDPLNPNVSRDGSAESWRRCRDAQVEVTGEAATISGLAGTVAGLDDGRHDLKTSASGPGMTVTVGAGVQVIHARRVIVAGETSLTFRRDPAAVGPPTVLVIRVARQLRLGRMGQIDLEGIEAHNVVWNVEGATGGRPALRRSSQLKGTLIAAQRAGVLLGNEVEVHGALKARSLRIGERCRVMHAPFLASLP